MSDFNVTLSHLFRISIQSVHSNLLGLPDIGEMVKGFSHDLMNRTITFGVIDDSEGHVFSVLADMSKHRSTDSDVHDYTVVLALRSDMGKATSTRTFTGCRIDGFEMKTPFHFSDREIVWYEVRMTWEDAASK